MPTIHVILLGIVLSATISQGYEYIEPSTCLKVQKKGVKVNLLASYRRQNHPIKAVLFVTKKGVEICADPNMAWVKRAIQTLDQKAKTQVGNKPTTNKKKPAGQNKSGKPNNRRRGGLKTARTSPPLIFSVKA
ncbi:eotaxin-like [Hyperolius riggenbachi]|uniref:eotaxin-like n=1 Tax=Hyperolius riggenbachi TaxID=752182 RepID=UPI0035A307C0